MKSIDGDGDENLQPLRRGYSLTHLVEILQQVDYPSLNFILGQTGGCRVRANSLGNKARSELRCADSNGGAADLEGSRSLNGGTGGGGPEGADNGGAEHCGKVDATVEKFDR